MREASFSHPSFFSSSPVPMAETTETSVYCVHVVIYEVIIGAAQHARGWQLLE